MSFTVKFSDLKVPNLDIPAGLAWNNDCRELFSQVRLNVENLLTLCVPKGSTKELLEAWLVRLSALEKQEVPPEWKRAKLAMNALEKVAVRTALEVVMHVQDDLIAAAKGQDPKAIIETIFSQAEEGSALWCAANFLHEHVNGEQVIREGSLNGAAKKFLDSQGVKVKENDAWARFRSWLVSDFFQKEQPEAQDAPAEGPKVEKPKPEEPTVEKPKVEKPKKKEPTGNSAGDNTGDSPGNTDPDDGSDEEGDHDMSDPEAATPHGAGIGEKLNEWSYHIQTNLFAESLFKGFLKDYISADVLEDARRIARVSGEFVGAFEKGCLFNVKGKKGAFKLAKDSAMLKLIRQYAGAAQHAQWKAGSPSLPEALHDAVSPLIGAIMNHLMIAGTKIPQISMVLRPQDVKNMEEGIKELEPQDWEEIFMDVLGDKDSKEERTRFLERLKDEVQRQYYKIAESDNPGVAWVRYLMRSKCVEAKVQEDMKAWGKLKGDDIERLRPLALNFPGEPNSLIAQAYRENGAESAFACVPANILVAQYAAQVLATEMALTLEMAKYEWNDAKATAGLPGWQLVEQGKNGEADKDHASLAALLADELMNMRDENGDSPWPFSKSSNVVKAIVWDIVARTFNQLAELGKKTKDGTLSIEQMIVYEALGCSRQVEAIGDGGDFEAEPGYVFTLGAHSFFLGAGKTVQWALKPVNTFWELTKAAGYAIAALCGEKDKRGYDKKAKIALRLARGLSWQFIKAPFVVLQNTAKRCWEWISGSTGGKKKKKGLGARIKAYLFNTRNEDGKVTRRRESLLNLAWKLPVRLVIGAGKAICRGVKSVVSAILGFFSGRKAKSYKLD